ncbi:MAG: TfoX/Sxy family protein [Verrucomicrobiales bacterium]
MPAGTWKKSPQALIERFGAALPAHPDLVRKPMFGYPAAFANGNMVCGLFEDSVVVRLGTDGAAEAVAQGKAIQFAPMPGRTMSGYVLVPAAEAEHLDSLAPWLQRALNYTLTLPAKQPKAAKATAARRVSKPKRFTGEA